LGRRREEKRKNNLGAIMSDEQGASIETSDTEPVEGQEKNTEATPATPTPETPPAKPDLVDDKFEFATPEDSKVDAESLKDFKAFVIEKSFTRETAQNVFDYMLQARTKFREAQEAATQAALEENIKTIKADPEIGGANYETVQKAVDKIALRYGGEDFKTAVNNFGFKNDPLFLRFINNLNSVLSEDKVITQSHSDENSNLPTSYEQLANKQFGEFVESFNN
jgi:hypothetical protein